MAVHLLPIDFQFFYQTCISGHSVGAPMHTEPELRRRPNYQFKTKSNRTIVGKSYRETGTCALSLAYLNGAQHCFRGDGKHFLVDGDTLKMLLGFIKKD